MQVLESVFSASYSKKDGTIPAPSADLQALHCAALSSWSLLLTLLTSGDVFRLATTQVSSLRGLLYSSDVDLRITAGESLALVLEFAYDYDSQYEPNELEGRAQRGRGGGASQPEGQVREGGAEVGHLVRGAAVPVVLQDPWPRDQPPPRRQPHVEGDLRAWQPLAHLGRQLQRQAEQGGEACRQPAGAKDPHWH